MWSCIVQVRGLKVQKDVANKWLSNLTWVEVTVHYLGCGIRLFWSEFGGEFEIDIDRPLSFSRPSKWQIRVKASCNAFRRLLRGRMRVRGRKSCWGIERASKELAARWHWRTSVCSLVEYGLLRKHNRSAYGEGSISKLLPHNSGCKVLNNRLTFRICSGWQGEDERYWTYCGRGRKSTAVGQGLKLRWAAWLG